MAKTFHDVNDPAIAELLSNGAVGVMPTDTVYGLVASARNPEAAERLLAVKGRKNKPGTMIAADVAQLESLGIKHRYLKAVEQFWPGTVSVVLPLGPELAYLHGGAFSLPVRIPDEPKLLKLLQSTGPLITTSANRPNKKTAESSKEAEAIFGDEVDFYVDGGNLSSRPPSTIIRIIDDAIEILREGAVKIDENGRVTT